METMERRIIHFIETSDIREHCVKSRKRQQSPTLTQKPFSIRILAINSSLQTDDCQMNPVAIPLRSHLSRRGLKKEQLCQSFQHWKKCFRPASTLDTSLPAGIQKWLRIFLENAAVFISLT